MNETNRDNIIDLMNANARLRQALIECGRAAGAFLSDDVSTDFLLQVPDEVRLKFEELTNKVNYG